MPQVTLTLPLILLTLLCPALPLTKTYTYSDPNIIYNGRTYVDSEGLRYSWPCTSIEFCFVNASKVWWLGGDAFGRYAVIVNGG